MVLSHAPLQPPPSCAYLRGELLDGCEETLAPCNLLKLDLVTQPNQTQACSSLHKYRRRKRPSKDCQL